MANMEKSHSEHTEDPASMGKVGVEHLAVDTTHNDEALKVLLNYTGSETWDQEEEKRLRRKIDRNLLPILCATYFLQYYDKAMIGQAALFGRRTDLKLTGNRFAFSSTIFYLGFIAGAYPAISMAQRWPIGRITAVYGSAVQMYLLAGALTILWSIVIFFFMLPDPIRAKCFTERERYTAVARLRSNNSGVRNTHFKINQVLELLTDVKFWMTFSLASLLMIGNGPASTFEPIIISGFGFNKLNSLLLTMPQGAFVGTVELMVPYIAYKVPRVRTYLIFFCLCLTLLASLLLWLLPRHATGGLLFAVYILPSYGGAYAVLIGLQLANTAGYTKHSISSTGIFMGYCLGNFVGPLLFKAVDAPRYIPGWIAIVATSATTGILALMCRFVCMWQNKQRDQSGELEAFDHAYEDDVTDRKNPQFRYIY